MCGARGPARVLRTSLAARSFLDEMAPLRSASAKGGGALVAARRARGEARPPLSGDPKHRGNICFAVLIPLGNGFFPSWFAVTKKASFASNFTIRNKTRIGTQSD